MTKIKGIRFFKAVSPLSRPIADSTHQIDRIALIVARLELDTGTAGDSYLLALDYPNDGPGWGFRFEDKYLTELP